MKKLFIVLILISSFQSLYSSPKSFIKLYFNNGKQPQVFLIDDIGKMAIKKFSNNFTLTVYYQKSLSAVYQTSVIDSMNFVDNNFNIYLSGSIKSFLVSEIDSIIFKENINNKNDTICTKLWMKKNLDVDHYRNGDPIPKVKDSTVWANLTTGAWCYYDNDPANGKIYGKLYNWYAVNDPRGLAPEGWHIPTDDEWKELEICLGMTKEEADKEGLRGSDEGSKLKEVGTAHWESPNTGATNSSGFSGLPGGERYFSNGRFNNFVRSGFWWLSTEGDALVA